MKYYFDNNATTQISAGVSREMSIAAYKEFGNPSGIYSFGVTAKNLINHARTNVASLFDSKPSQIVFTGSATESNNTIIHSALLQNPDRKTVIYSAVEHPSVFQTLMQYRNKGYNLLKIPVSETGIDEQFIYRNLSSDIALVTIMTVNNETGQVFPVNRIFSMIKEYDPSIICHSDAVQAIGKISISTSNIDYISISAHKFHGPKGVACIYKDDNMKMLPLMYGGAQENGMRPGTENVAGIVGMGKAASEINGSIDAQKRLKQYQDMLENSMKELDSYIVCKESKRVPGVSNIGFAGIEANELLLRLNREGIYVSTGSACSSNRIGISRIIKEMGIDEKYSSTIRISMSKYTTEEEVKYLIEKLRIVINKYSKNT